MSQQDRENDRRTELRNYAEHILKRNNAVIICPTCAEHEVYNSDDEAVRKSYAQARRAVDSKAIDGSFEEISAALRDVIDDTPSDCPTCEADLED